MKPTHENSPVIRGLCWLAWTVLWKFWPDRVFNVYTEGSRSPLYRFGNFEDYTRWAKAVPAADFAFFWTTEKLDHGGRQVKAP